MLLLETGQALGGYRRLTLKTTSTNPKFAVDLNRESIAAITSS